MRSWISPRRADQEFQQELSAHLEMLTYENIQRGMVPIEAQRAARIRLGGLTQHRATNLEFRGLFNPRYISAGRPPRRAPPVQESRLQITERILDLAAYRAGVASEYVACWCLFDCGQTMSKFGGRLTGTDAPVPGSTYGASEHVELALLVRDGLSPVQALAAATSVPAQTLHLEDRGWIRPGMRADLVLEEGDPTTNILATRDIVAVWKRGIRAQR